MPKIIQLYRDSDENDCALADDGTTWYWGWPTGGTVGAWHRWTDPLPQDETDPNDLVSALTGLIGLVQLIIPTLDGSQRIGVEQNHRLTVALAVLARVGGGS